MNNDLLKQLRTALVQLYPTAEDMVRVAQDAGIAIERVSLHASPLNNWHALLQEAAKSWQVADLLYVACEEYPNNPALEAAQAAFLATQQQPPTVAPTDHGLIVLNFNRALTPTQVTQLEQQLGEAIHTIIALDQRFDDKRPYAPQCIALLNRLGWTPEQWETTPLLILPPGFAAATLTLISIIHGRRGYFPAMARFRPEETGTRTDYVLAEIINLQALRNGAHGRKQR